jgi:hypothetical protein
VGDRLDVVSGMRSASCVDSKRYDVREASAVFFRGRKYVYEVIDKSVYPTVERRRRDDSEWRRKSDGNRLGRKGGLELELSVVRDCEALMVPIRHTALSRWLGQLPSLRRASKRGVRRATEGEAKRYDYEGQPGGDCNRFGCRTCTVSHATMGISK